MTTLFDPEAHEPLSDTAWDAERARKAIRAIVTETERAFDGDELWPPHPLDQEDLPLRRPASLYLGAAGVVWALEALRRGGEADLTRAWGGVAVSRQLLAECVPAGEYLPHDRKQEQAQKCKRQTIASDDLPHARSPWPGATMAKAVAAD